MPKPGPGRLGDRRQAGKHGQSAIRLICGKLVGGAHDILSESDESRK